VAETFFEITEKLAAFIERQHVFFVATAPSGDDGHVNVSPKGLDTFRILEPTSVAYLDLTGSGIETVSHLRDNGRICIMFCAFEGSAQILRLHGRGEVLEAGTPAFGSSVSRLSGQRRRAATPCRSTRSHASATCSTGTGRGEPARCSRTETR
jgi:hypothetical protein